MLSAVVGSGIENIDTDSENNAVRGGYKDIVDGCVEFEESELSMLVVYDVSSKTQIRRTHSPRNTIRRPADTGSCLVEVTE